MKKTIITLALAILFIGSSALASDAIILPESVIPGGHTVGIRMQTDGIIIIGFTPVMTEDGQKNPASDSGLMLGDRITHINDIAVETAQELHGAVKASRDIVVARLIRKTEERTIQITPAVASQNGEKKLGILIRDGMSGIGTMTFYDPESGLFGALGHGVNDTDTGDLLPLAAGDIIPSTITDIKMGRAGIPGELRGEFPDTERRGEILMNTDGGIFGFLEKGGTNAGFTAQPIPLADHTRVKTGPATILCNIQGDKVESFDIEIVRMYPKQDLARNMQLRVTDPALLAITGGIVQGMSGSPIVQDGYLIGAVTHVMINDPKRGYGIYVENMFETGSSLIQKPEMAA